MSAPFEPDPALEAQPLESWLATKTTLHLWSQIVGKIRLATTPHHNQWWNATLRFTPRGLAALGMHANGRDFELEFDFVDHKLIGRTSTGEKAAFELRDGLSVGSFYAQTLELLRKLQITVKIIAKPYGIPITTPFAEDVEHNSYDAAAVLRWWNIARWTINVMNDFSSDFAGKQSPPQLFWHTFDIAYARYSGRTAPLRDGASVVEQEAYYYEVIAFGFWPGDERVPEPTFYTYTSPEPGELTQAILRPAQAHWVPSGSGHIGIVAYDIIRSAIDPHAALKDFFASGFEAGSRATHWPLDDLRCHFDDLRKKPPLAH